MYRLGYTKYDNWDLIVTSVRDVEQTISMLDFLRMTYIIPEEENGVVWKIPKKYSLEQIAKKLTDLPASFNLGSAFVFWEKIEKFKKYEHFSFDLTENEGYLNTP
ncbi:hypothetical protein MTDSW087_03284 [Methylobacterium dankookense]|uniref:Uncharacterized protein n=2 Tax=Methylobacterium dankookense TaxID=560405 RepID=A0A564G036_9HYPH|nr:hypothetical protein IFDJLNFL_5026 [Methylobacterium dankookense]VUF13577.1 hypothetical protein MTDSW087_03284 [Methylobacterium dankookense]